MRPASSSSYAWSRSLYGNNNNSPWLAWNVNSSGNLNNNGVYNSYALVPAFSPQCSYCDRVKALSGKEKGKQDSRDGKVCHTKWWCLRHLKLQA